MNVSHISADNVRNRKKQPLLIMQFVFEFKLLSEYFILFQLFIARMAEAIENSFHVERVDSVRWNGTLVNLLTDNPTVQSHISHFHIGCIKISTRFSASSTDYYSTVVSKTKQLFIAA